MNLPIQEQDFLLQSCCVSVARLFFRYADADPKRTVLLYHGFEQVVISKGIHRRNYNRNSFSIKREVHLCNWYKHINHILLPFRDKKWQANSCNITSARFQSPVDPLINKTTDCWTNWCPWLGDSLVRLNRSCSHIWQSVRSCLRGGF